ncbi:MAG: indole-3-glycerol phosphate synthase TrpC [Fibrobacterota bacterium]|nr:indole-3-glycerol phosphate synthase TrpC [Fibrobacterota bacterium]QQS04179.1 MAG: indole-3-glycerol phosphate synthase TrpC [Fibrobacterota bacterium]
MSILQRIAASKLAQIQKRRQTLPEDELEKMALLSPLSGHALRENLKRASGAPINVLAECKKASPSKGVMIEDYDPLKLARKYLAGGAAGISVLTETEFFLGDDAHLRSVTGSIPLPILRKDFTLERYQILEARCLGASAILLIAALLPDAKLKELAADAAYMGLDVIIEIHSWTELEPALAANPPILGINNRNLDTFEVSLDTTFDLLADIPKGTVVISESGISHREQCQKLEEAGVDAILIGEGVGTTADPAAKIRELRGLA